MHEGSVAEAIDLVAGSRRVVALTGAGLSTPSGIPDFRSPGSGLWERDDPYVVASASSFRRDPRPFFDWIAPLVECSAGARPNPAHYALVNLEQRGRLTAIVTQNIDGLQQQAGSANVLELHGSLRTARCLRCGRRVDGLAAFALRRPDAPVPRCDQGGCGGVLKPEIVLFEEPLPENVLARARAACLACDLVLVAGSSLDVLPASRLPVLALRAGARLLIVNRGPTALDEFATAVLRGDVAEILPAIAEAVD